MTIFTTYLFHICKDAQYSTYSLQIEKKKPQDLVISHKSIKCRYLGQVGKVGIIFKLTHLVSIGCHLFSGSRSVRLSVCLSVWLYLDRLFLFLWWFE